jgi:glycosyltransferase involved in cell wall biosynthesis
MVTHSYYLRDPRVRREAETLAAHGYEVDMVCLRRPGEPMREPVNGVRIYRIPLTHKRASRVRYLFEYGLSLVMATLWLSALSVRRRYALVQIHTPPDLLVFSAFVPRLRGARVLLDMHDPMPEVMLTKFDEGERGWFGRAVLWQERVSVRFAHFVVTVTEQVRQALVARGVPPSKVAIVMNFADGRIFNDVKASRPTSLDDRPVAVFMGTLAYRYGMDIALTAMTHLRKRVPGARLRVIGEGEERPRLEAQARELGLQDTVEFVGQVPIDRIPAAALPADVGIAPHRRDRLYDMCFPSKIYDYLALGLPVVAAWTQSLDYYYGKDTIAFFDSEDAEGLAREMAALLADPGRIAAQRQNGRRFLETHSWAIERERYLAIVNRLVNSRCSSAPRPSV